MQGTPIVAITSEGESRDQPGGWRRWLHPEADRRQALPRCGSLYLSGHTGVAFTRPTTPRSCARSREAGRAAGAHGQRAVRGESQARRARAAPADVPPEHEPRVRYAHDAGRGLPAVAAGRGSGPAHPPAAQVPRVHPHVDPEAAIVDRHAARRQPPRDRSAAPVRSRLRLRECRGPCGGRGGHALQASGHPPGLRGAPSAAGPRRSRQSAPGDGHTWTRREVLGARLRGTVAYGRSHARHATISVRGRRAESVHGKGPDPRSVYQ